MSDVSAPAPASVETKIAEVRVSKLAANSVGVVATVAACAVGIALVRAHPQHFPYANWHSLPLLAALIVLIVAHEGVHALGLRLFAGVPWRQIKFGVMWQALMPYCHCPVPVPLVAYRRMALLPLWATLAAGVVAIVALPTDAVGALAGVLVAACVGDVWMVAKLRRFAGPVFVQDSPTEIGCDVLAIARKPAV